MGLRADATAICIRNDRQSRAADSNSFSVTATLELQPCSTAVCPKTAGTSLAKDSQKRRKVQISSYLLATRVLTRSSFCRIWAASSGSSAYFRPVVQEV